MLKLVCSKIKNTNKYYARYPKGSDQTVHSCRFCWEVCVCVCVSGGGGGGGGGGQVT